MAYVKLIRTSTLAFSLLNKWEMALNRSRSTCLMIHFMELAPNFCLCEQHQKNRHISMENEWEKKNINGKMSWAEKIQ